MIDTSANKPLPEKLLYNYFKSLVNSFFKILPIRESGEKSLGTYMQSLQLELIGCKELLPSIKEDSGFLSLIAILQYLIDNPECSVGVVKREVFKAISICNRLKAQYAEVE